MPKPPTHRRLCIDLSVDEAWLFAFNMEKQGTEDFGERKRAQAAVTALGAAIVDQLVIANAPPNMAFANAADQKNQAVLCAPRIFVYETEGEAVLPPIVRMQ